MSIKVGNTIVLTSFAYTNKFGGTGLSNWNHDEKYLKPATFKVIKTWHDYECGQRGWAVPFDTDKKLLTYLERNAKRGRYDLSDLTDLNAWIDDGKYVIFWSEWDTIENSRK